MEDPEVSSIDERRAIDAPTRIPKSIVVATLLALTDAISLFALVVTVMLLMAKGAIIKQYDLDDDSSWNDVSVSEGLASPVLVVALIGTFACLLTLYAESTKEVGAKTKARNVVGVCWALNIGVSLVAAVLWGTTYFKEFFLVLSPSVTFSWLCLSVMTSNATLFVLSIVLTALCYLTRYSGASCFRSNSGSDRQPLVNMAQSLSL